MVVNVDWGYFNGSFNVYLYGICRKYIVGAFH